MGDAETEPFSAPPTFLAIAACTSSVSTSRLYEAARLWPAASRPGTDARLLSCAVLPTMRRCSAVYVGDLTKANAAPSTTPRRQKTVMSCQWFRADRPGDSYGRACRTTKVWTGSEGTSSSTA